MTPGNNNHQAGPGNASGAGNTPEAGHAPRPVEPPDDRPGKDPVSASQQIPGYRILGKLGSGAMAVVFKAKQLSLDRVVAIKVLPKRLSADREYVERFYQEGQAAAKLNHPNIVQAIDVGEAQGYHYFVMEYVKGHTVYDDLATGKIFPESEALDITIQIARALEHAHSQGLIHRDVKPKNIMLTTGGIAKLMDMGLARVADDAGAIQAEQGKLYGTPFYISPEQILGKQDVDFRCDIYSLGATLYHMVTGKMPFDGKDSREVMVKHVKQALTPPDRHNLDLSFGLCKIIQRMMSKKPSNRHQSTTELVEDLQSVDFLLEVENPGGSRIGEDLSGRLEHIAPDAPKESAPDHTSQPRVVAELEPTDFPENKCPLLNTILVVGLAISLLLNVILLLILLLR